MLVTACRYPHAGCGSFHGRGVTRSTIMDDMPKLREQIQDHLRRHGGNHGALFGTGNRRAARVSMRSTADDDGGGNASRSMLRSSDSFRTTAEANPDDPQRCGGLRQLSGQHRRTRRCDSLVREGDFAGAGRSAICDSILRGLFPLVTCMAMLNCSSRKRSSSHPRIRRRITISESSITNMSPQRTVDAIDEYERDNRS